MAKKDSLDTDVRKPAKPASGRGSLLTVVTLLWLAGLTAFVFMMLKKSDDSGLENRVAKLETKAAAVGGKIKKPGTENVETAKDESAGPDAAQMAGLEQRLAQLEQKLGEFSASGAKPADAAAETSAAGTAPLSGGYDELKSKVDDLEAKLLACGACAEKPVAKAVVPEKKTEPKKAVARAKKKAKPRVTTARKSSPVYKGPAPVAAAPNAVKAPQMGTYEHYDTVYDISMRVGPMYGHTDRDSIDYSRMAPGAAIHPASNPAPGSSFAGTSTYYNKGLFE